ncbi:type II secretion system F family protein [Pelagibius sp. Alg239-R121]|uniref:type II secretion system F family protein n=1 Tax=Pelagibius sp. Alg239-R121 TaxID=2993448 RepID=UPI0024A610B8|nr:type II secretion system F family protein [Pelagibius sp. Alg239-R121]
MSVERYLPAGVTIEDLIIVMSAITVLISFAAVWSSLLHRDPSQKRAKLIAEQREALRGGMLAPRRRKERLNSASFMRQVVDRMQLMKSAQAGNISAKLMRAGWRSKDAVVRYLFFKLALPVVLGGLAILVFYGFNSYGLSASMKLVACVATVGISAYLPDTIIKNAAQKRQESIRKSLPDGLDLMVICSEAGLSLDATLNRVSQEMAGSAPELADEMSLTGLELGFLPERRAALDNLAQRTDLQMLRSLVNTLIQAERYGTPLSQSLRVMSSESREERLLKAEEKAARLPAMMTVPMIMFILPPLFVVLLGPAIVNTIDALSTM